LKEKLNQKMIMLN